MKLNLKKPIAFFDIEATGLNVTKDRIVEISILKLNTNSTREIRTWLLNPEYPICKEASMIHGYSNDDLTDKPTFKQVAKDISRFLTSCDLAGYNALKFDIPMLVEEFLRANVDFEIKKRRLVDVQNIFMKMEQRSLNAAYRFYLGKELKNAHNAEADTLATFEILEAQLDRYADVEYKDKEGNTSIPVINDIQSLNDFSSHHKNADLMGQIIFNKEGKETINFGKYKGKTVEEIFSKDPSYYSWIMKADFPQYTKNLMTKIKLNLK
ncbi:MAG TPA: 3'-5' exonuclease [Bacteroidales bacterium]|jgi:DNA polymerase-3 subunit epsilon|nr:DNA polymerase III subunit epsilon [Bacteroidota bacterium]HJN05236.1 3'-5' exonuclease [Bacteroidales bacterium]|tara:strand:+ start:551 stop:1351 length:801 start_codon:yes stop_codon:yes gene_type:complete